MPVFVKGWGCGWWVGVGQERETDLMRERTLNERKQDARLHAAPNFQHKNTKNIQMKNWYTQSTTKVGLGFRV